LSGANTYSGLTTVSAGALNVQNSSALGSTNSGTTVASGATLFLSGGVSVTNEILTLNGTGLSALGALRNFTNNNSWNGTITLAAAATIGSDTNTLTLGAGGIVVSNFLATFTGGGNIIASGSIGNGTNGLTKTGAGTLTLTASNSYGGLTTVSAGVLNVQNNFALGGTTLGTTVASGAALQLQNGVSVTGETLSLNGTGVAGSGALRNLGGSNTWSGLITLAGSATFAADSGTLDLEANISNSTSIATFTNTGTIILNGVLGGGSGAFVKSGTGLLSLGNANTFTGTTTISGGTVQFSSTGNLPAASALTVNTGSILDLNGFNKSILSLAGAGGVILNGGTLTVNNSAATTFSGVISGAGGLQENGAGTLTLGGVNTFTGGTTINAGAISIAADTALGNATNALTLNGGQLVISATLASARPITLGANGGVLNTGTKILTLSNTISGPGALTKTGTGTLTLLGTSTWLGGTTNGAGILTISADSQLGDSGGALVFSNTATLTTTASFTSARNIFLNPGTATFSCGTGFTNTFNGVISGAGALTQSGAGMMVLGGANTFTNLLTISKGTVQLGGSERISDLAPVLISATTATFDLNNFNETIGSLASSAAGAVKLGGGFLTAGGNNLTTTNSAVISGSGGFTKAGAGLMLLSGANTYTSNTIVAVGTLQISASERIANTSPLVISNGAVFNLNNFSETVASLAGAGSVTLGTGTLTAGNTGTANFSGTISGPGAVAKVGSGTQIFSGANSYSGATTISVGNLQVNGSDANSAVTIASAATLSGGGTVGTVVVNSGATNSPGASAPGTLTSGTETWAGGGNYIWEINNAAGTKGVNSDWLNLSGALNITATSGSKFNLRLVSLTPANATGQVVNFDNTLTYVWTIASASGGITGFNAASFNLITTSFQNALGAGTFTLSQSGNDLNLIFTSAAAAAIKGVQSGTLTSNGNGTNTATLGTAVNPTNAFLIFNTRHNSGVPGGSMIRGSITSSNTVTFVRATTETSTMNIQWYVVEYSAGVRVQRGEVNQTNTTINVPLAPLGSVGQAFVTWSKTPDPSETSFSDSDPAVGEITSTTNLQFRVSAAPSATPIISWQVIEFLNPASISVQKGSVTNLTGTNLSATVTLAAPVNTNSTFLLTGYRTSGSGSGVGARMLRAQLASANAITFDRSLAGAPDDISEIEWQAVQLNDGSLVQSGSVNFTNGVAETNVTLISLNTNRAAAFSSVQPAGGQNTGRSPSTGNILGVGSATLAMTSSSQLTLDRNNTSDQADLGWQVVGFGPGALLVPATGGSAISADTTTNTYTSLTGPLYTEIQNGNVGVGTIILKTPAGFIFDTNVTKPTVLITRVSGSGADTLNLNGVASGTSAAMTTVNQTNLIFTVTSASSNGVTCSLTWQNLRVRPTTGTNLASGNIVDTGTSVIQGVTTNSTGWGFLAEVTGAAAKIAITTQPSTNVTAGVDFPVQPVVQVQDQFGNLRTTDNSTVITATSSGTDTNDVNGSITAVGGVTAFGGLDYRIAQTNTITFSSPGFTSKNSSNIVVSAAAASQLTVVSQPSATATAGIKFAQQPVVQVQDAFGNLIKSDNSTVVTADIAQGSADLTGSINLTAKNGVATFTNLSYPIAETITIDFTNPMLDYDTSTSITVNPVSQTITFGALTNKIFGAADFTVSASASSGLPVTFSILSGAATISGNIISLTGAGTLTVRASQPGDATYAAAPSVDQSFTVAKASSSLAVASSANPSPTGSNVTFTATASSTAGTPTGAVQFLADGISFGSPVPLGAGSGGVASVVTASLAHGTHTISAQYAGDGNFLGSTNHLSASQIINTAPVTATDYWQRHAGSGAKVRVANLLANDADPDGDALNFVSTDATSANGGTVSLQGSWITYNPPAGFIPQGGTDSFNYVIADSGGLQATGTVSIAVVADTEPCQNNGPVADLGHGAFQVYFNGIPARTYTIQFTDANTPDWQPLGTATADASGKFNFTDSPASGSPARSYRSISQ
jgi:autotransporter-associated beta strand protein